MSTVLIIIELFCQRITCRIDVHHLGLFPSTIQAQRKCLSFKLFKRYIDCFSCANWSRWREAFIKLYMKYIKHFALWIKHLRFMHQSIPPAPSTPPPGLLRGICPPCQSRGPSICQPPGHSRAFDTHAVSYQNKTTQKVVLEKKQIGSSVKDRNKL